MGTIEQQAMTPFELRQQQTAQELGMSAVTHEVVAVGAANFSEPLDVSVPNQLAPAHQPEAQIQTAPIGARPGDQAARM